VMGITAEEIVELFEKDVRSRKRLAELLISEPDIRLTIITAVLRDVATKEDTAKIEKRIDRIDERMNRIEEKMDKMEERMNKMEERMSRIEEKIAGLESRISGVERELDKIFKLMIVTILGILISITTTILTKILLL